MSGVTGILFSSLKPVFKNVYGDTLNEKKIFLIGLFFNQFIIWLISIWCFFNVDPNWIMLYWVDPESVLWLIYVIYIIFPLFYILPYAINLKLRDAGKSRYMLLIATSLWIIFTISVFPDFVTMFAGNDIPMHGEEYPAQVIYDLHSYPDRNILWIIPMSFRTYFIMFFIQVILFMTLVLLIGISIARKNTINFPPEQPSKSLILLTNIILDVSNKLIIRLAKKDYRFRQFVKKFEAKIQFSTRDGSINKFIVFDGKGGIVYAKGTLETPDATVLFQDVRSLFMFLKTFGDFKLGVKYNRFKVYGNLNMLLKLEFLTNYFNPKVKKIKGYKQKIIGSLE